METFEVKFMWLHPDNEKYLLWDNISCVDVKGNSPKDAAFRLVKRFLDAEINLDDVREVRVNRIGISNGHYWDLFQVLNKEE